MLILGLFLTDILQVSAGHIRDGEEGDEGDDEGEAGKFSGNRLQKSVFHAFAHFLWNKPHHHPRSATGRWDDDAGAWRAWRNSDDLITVIFQYCWILL